MPPKLHDKLQDNNFVTWAQYNNIAGIVATAIMIATAFYGVKVEVTKIQTQMEDHLKQGDIELKKWDNIIGVVNDNQADIARLKQVTGVK